MNIFLSSLERRLSQFAITSSVNQSTSFVQTHHPLPLPCRHLELDERIIYLNPLLQKTPWQLPARQRETIFTFPAANREPIRVPGLLVSELLRIFDPLTGFQIPLEAPQRSPVVEKFAGERMLKIRRHKMRKHKRRKRFDRDYFKYQKYHRQKKAKAENLFRSRMNKMMEEFRVFDPEKYIKDIIARAKQDVTKNVAPSGRRKYPHWSTLITLEELYGLPPSDYIDKKAGLAGEEDREKIRQLKKEYDEKYRGFLSRSTSYTSGVNPTNNVVAHDAEKSVAEAKEVEKDSDEKVEASTKKNPGIADAEIDTGSTS